MATRLTLGVVALLVLLQLIVLATYAGNVQERREAEVENATDVGRTLAAVVDGFTRDLEGMTSAAAFAVGSNDGALDQETLGPYLARLRDEYDILRALFVTDTAGRVLASASGEGIGFEVWLKLR